MQLTRREFLETGVGSITVLGFSICRTPESAHAGQNLQPKPFAEIPLVWLATGACTGCSVSLLNAASPTIRFVLVGNVLPRKRLGLTFHTTLMASGGDMAADLLEKVIQEQTGAYVLVVDGATATAADGAFCTIGEADGKPVSGYRRVCDLARNAMLLLGVGTCASFGGIPAAAPNPTGCVSLRELCKRERIETPLVNIPGCPPHPDWITGAIAAYLLGGVEALRLDALRRPAVFFSHLIHDNCPYRGHFERGEFAERFGDHGCLIKLGCKGPITHADCPIRRWNNGINWCVEAGHPCIGCCEPGFPFERSLFTPVQPVQLTFPGMYPAAVQEQRRQADANTYAAIGMVGAAAFLAGAGVATAARKLQSETAEEPPGGKLP